MLLIPFCRIKLNDWFGEEKSEQDARDCMLNYYSSETVEHGGYVLSSFIGIFALIQVKDAISKTVPFIVPLNTLVLLISAFLTFIVYLVVRIAYWGTITSYALHAPMVSIEEMERQRKATNRLNRINYSCVQELKCHHAYIYFFSGVMENTISTFAKYVPIFIVSVIVLSLV